MNGYEPSTPRGAFAIAAFAMSALTLSLAIVAPAHFERGAPEAHEVAAKTAPALPRYDRAVLKMLTLGPQIPWLL